MFAHREVGRSFRPSVDFSDMETSKRRKMVCPSSYGYSPAPLRQAWLPFSTSSLSFLLYFQRGLVPHCPSAAGLWLLCSARPISGPCHPLLPDDAPWREEDPCGCRRAQCHEVGDKLGAQEMSAWSLLQRSLAVWWEKTIIRSHWKPKLDASCVLHYRIFLCRRCPHV